MRNQKELGKCEKNVNDYCRKHRDDKCPAGPLYAASFDDTWRCYTELELSDDKKTYKGNVRGLSWKKVDKAPKEGAALSHTQASSFGTQLDTLFDNFTDTQKSTGVVTIQDTNTNLYGIDSVPQNSYIKTPNSWYFQVQNTTPAVDNYCNADQDTEITEIVEICEGVKKDATNDNIEIYIALGIVGLILLVAIFSTRHAATAAAVGRAEAGAPAAGATAATAATVKRTPPYSANVTKKAQLSATGSR